MQILVTGGCGFIGVNLVPMLVADGACVRVLDKVPVGRGVDFDRHDVRVMQGDVRDVDMLSRAIDGADAVIHLAAQGSVVDSVAKPRGSFEVNVVGTFNVLQACVAGGARKFIFASTGGALIGNVPPPVDEQSLPWPVSPYGATKLCGEAYCHAFAGSYGLETIALRFANVYGPHSARKQSAVTNFIKRSLSGEPLTIYGDGSASRDFLYVDDLCDGIRAALDAPLTDEVIHLASGVETRIDALAKTILEITARADAPIVSEPRRRGEIEHNFATVDRARELLGFAPRYALREGLERTVRWFAANRGQWDDDAGGSTDG